MERNQVYQYPALEINLNKVYDNIKTMVEIGREKDIEIAGVIKGFNGLTRVVNKFVEGGCKHLATSRLDQIIQLKDEGIQHPFMLIRIPMLSEVKKLVQYADISLNSELSVIERIHEECKRQNKRHKVILMADLGDLREGFWDKGELVEAACYIEKKLDGIELYGVGTNLGCYGSIKPTEEKMNELCSIAEEIEEKINRKLDIISGGATSSIPLILENKMPKGINHLRIGEGIILAKDLPDLWGLDMDYMHQDIFTLKAEIIEMKRKPTYPVGEIAIDSFGNKPTYTDRGIRKRALLAMGKLDYALNDKIIPRQKGIEIVGSSSDHLIIDIEDYEGTLKIGDILEFDIYYPAMIYLTNSRYINITYVE
ncbi:alanine/ornithine racemase family PLP-dependent enzyme [Clostridiaceae bacterium 35-E11]